MAEHESCLGASDDWYTPFEIFDALKLTFDLDPCSPGLNAPHCCVPARQVYTMADNGLVATWPPGAIVFVNMPFGARHGHVPWLKRFFDHANGIAIVRAYTSSDWWHDVVVPNAESLLFPKGKTKFVRGTDMWSKTKKGRVFHPAGSRGESPGHGVVLIGMGEVANAALRQSGLGHFQPVYRETAP